MTGAALEDELQQARNAYDLQSYVQLLDEKNAAFLAQLEGQQAMIDRKYGLFLHYGMNTYLGKQWSDGTDPAGAFSPPGNIA